MKKSLSLVLLTGFMLVSFVPAFAAEKTNLPYVEGLGKVVQL
jgi:putative bacteriocin